jgi:starch synthase
MRILLASSEVHPYSKTGGLADMVGALGKALAKAGHHIWIVTPLYAGIRERLGGSEHASLHLDLPLGGEFVRGDVVEFKAAPRLRVCFVRQPDMFERENLYQENGRDYPDNSKRFIFFSKAVVEVARRLVRPPDIIHVHDWQASLVSLLIRSLRERGGWGMAPKVLLTIHNLAYQGVFPAVDFGLTNLSWDYFTTPYAEYYGQMNCLKAGIMSADGLSTVSPRYAREILTSEFGCGLDGCLRARHAMLRGILNGVDYEEWNTESNPHLRHGFNVNAIEGKIAEKLDLQQELGLSRSADRPLFGTISRLAEQKGIDLLLGALEEMVPSGIQFILLGSGLQELEEAFRKLAVRHSNQVSVKIGFDPGLSHRIEAGCDFFLMPSRFEPCGLNQMYSLRYGTIPVVRRTGGLDDSVLDATDDPSLANGIKFGNPSPRALANAIRKGLIIYGDPILLRHYQRNGMLTDFSWDRTRKEYEDLYTFCSGNRAVVALL